jgi:hypothetical protein
LGNKQSIGQNDVSTFLSSLKGTNGVAVAALKSRLEFSGLDFKYKGLKTDPAFERPHKPVALEIRERLDQKLSQKPTEIRWKIALKLLYELGARA